MWILRVCLLKIKFLILIALQKEGQKSQRVNNKPGRAWSTAASASPEASSSTPGKLDPEFVAVVIVPVPTVDRIIGISETNINRLNF